MGVLSWLFGGRDPENMVQIDNPAAAFEKPSDVVSDRSLTNSEKKEALDTWEQDARQLMTASNEGMPGREEGLDPEDHHRMADVVRAKGALGERPKPKPAHWKIITAKPVHERLIIRLRKSKKKLERCIDSQKHCRREAERMLEREGGDHYAPLPIASPEWPRQMMKALPAWGAQIPQCQIKPTILGIRSMTIEKVKLIVVRHSAPDVEVQLGIFPSKDAALPEFGELIAKADTLRATIDPIEGERTEANSASYNGPLGPE
jgi:hypothetical protein